MSAASLVSFRAGPGALAHVQRHGLAPADIACIPAAAGGPKGLALIPFDKLFYREWLDRPGLELELIGASVGAWRMAALAQPDPVAALDRLVRAYVRDQNYAERPSTQDVAVAIAQIARAVLGGRPLEVRDGVALTIVTSHARGPLANTESKLAFARATLTNAVSRTRLASHLERVLFVAGRPGFMQQPFDAFGLVRVPIEPDNAADALLASGTIPLVCTPVRDIAGAPAGCYWDGALVDYHLLLPYPQLTRGGDRAPHRLLSTLQRLRDAGAGSTSTCRGARRRAATPGSTTCCWWRPSPAFLARLPNGKLPDRQDFYRYGQDHAARIRDWERAIGECERFAEAVLRWLERPDPSLLAPI